MLINLSNHPKAKWDQAQLAAAEEQFGRIEDLSFPLIDPNASLAEVTAIARQYAEKCATLLAHQHHREKSAVHIMGEFTFTYQFLKQMESLGILCVASTTERLVTENADGSKTTVFKFVQFRPYFGEA
jgi:hypothetical protein